MMIEPLVGAQQLADYLQVPLATVYRWRHRGEGPRGYRVGRHVRYSVEEIEAWLLTRADDPDIDVPSLRRRPGWARVPEGSGAPEGDQ